MTNNGGNSGDLTDQTGGKIFLTLVGVKGGPCVELKSSITIGSDVGELCADDSNLSARHCTIVNNQGILSIIDHSSKRGTFIGKTKIRPGRFYILQDDDKVLLGKTELDISPFIVDRSAAETSTSIQTDIVQENTPREDMTQEMVLSDLMESEAEVIDLGEDDIIDTDIFDEGPIKKKHKPSKKKKTNRKKDTKPKKVIIGNSYESANAFLRALAYGLDILIAYSFYQVFYIYTDIKNFHDFALITATEFINPYMEAVYKIVPTSEQVIANIGTDTLTFFFGCVFLVTLLRVMTSIILGVSLGQRLLGIKAEGRGFLPRILSPIREIIGVLLFPLLICDLPAVFDKRTLKEMLTFTVIGSSSKMRSLLGGIIFFPLCIGISLLSPMFKGLEFKNSVKADMVISVPKLTDKAAGTLYTDQSLSLVESDKYITVLGAGFEKSKSKSSLKPSIIFFNKKNLQFIELQKRKSLNVNSILSGFVNGNFLISHFNPHIMNYIGSLDGVNNKRENLRVVKEELAKVLDASFRLDPIEALSFVTKEGPFLSPYILLRNQIEGLLGSKRVMELSIAVLGSEIVASFKITKNQYFYLPLTLGYSHLYFSEENLFGRKGAFLQKKIMWSSTLADDKLDGFFKYFSQNEEDPELSQKVYESYYEIGKIIVQKNDEKAVDKFDIYIEKMLNILEKKPELNKKLFLNLSEVLQALRGRNASFFGINRDII